MRPAKAQQTLRKGSVQISVPRGDSIISTFNQKSQQQKIIELQQKHKELRRVRRENKVNSADIKEKDADAFDQAVIILFEKDQLITIFNFQQGMYNILRIFGMMMIAKVIYNFTFENSDFINQLGFSLLWVGLLKFGKFYLMSNIQKTIIKVQEEYQNELQDLKNGLGVNKREGSFKKYSTNDTTAQYERNSLLGIGYDTTQYNKIQSGIINNRTMTFKTKSQQMLPERDTSFKENRSSITSFNTSSRRLIQGVKKPVPQAFVTQYGNNIDEFLQNQNVQNHLFLCFTGAIGVWFISLKGLFHDKTKIAAHVTFIILFTRFTINLNQFVFDLSSNIFIAYFSMKKLHSMEIYRYEEFKRVNELSHKYGRYERIFQNMRSGYAILSYQAIHFQNENFKKTLGIKQDIQIFPVLKQIKRRMRLFGQGSNQNDSSGIEKKNNTQVIKFVSAMEDLVNFLRNKPTVEINEEIEYYSEKIDSRSGQKYIKFFILTFQFILWDGQQKIQLTIRDITQDKKHLDQRILQQLRNMMFKSFTHEIKTPLNAVVQSIDLSNQFIKQNLTPCDKNINNKVPERRNYKQLQNYMNTIESGIHILQNNLNDLIDYQMIENGEMKINPKTFKLKDCYDQIIRIIKPQIQNPNVKFTNFFDPNIATSIESDQERIIRIVLNLLLNAQKFTQSGFIKFTMKSVMQKRDVSTPQSGRVRNTNFVRFEVSDSGLGIPDDKKPYIFNLFESDLMALGSLNQSQHQKSAKVGLPICQLLCQKLGGLIKVHSQKGEGSKFWFILPVVQKRVENSMNQGESSAHKNPANIEDTEASGSEEEKLEFIQKYSSEDEDESNYGLPENFAMTSQMLHDNILINFFQPQNYDYRNNQYDDKFDDEQSEMGNTLFPGHNNNLLDPRKSSNFQPRRTIGGASIRDPRKKSQFAYQTFNAINCEDDRRHEELKNDISPSGKIRPRSNQRLAISQNVNKFQQAISNNTNGNTKNYQHESNHLRLEFLNDRICPKKPNDFKGMRQLKFNSNYKMMKRRAYSDDYSVTEGSEDDYSNPIVSNGHEPFILQNLKLQNQIPNNIPGLYLQDACIDRVNSEVEHMTFSNFAQVQTSIFRTASHKYPQQNQVPIEKAFDNGCECSQVLIVDDIDMNRIFLSEILKRNFNIKSDQAIDGLECLKTVKEKQFNECCSYYQLIFMDFEMPIMNGMEASRKIAGYKIKGKIDVRTVIIGYTAYTDEENNCLSNGMEFFLPKPASCAQIKACLEEVKRKQHENQNKASPKSNRKRKITNQASVIMNSGSDNVVTPHLFNPNIISSDLKAPTLNSVAHNSAAFENIIQIQPPFSKKIGSSYEQY
eukprot:403342524